MTSTYIEVQCTTSCYAAQQWYICLYCHAGHQQPGTRYARFTPFPILDWLLLTKHVQFSEGSFVLVFTAVCPSVWWCYWVQMESAVVVYRPVTTMIQYTRWCAPVMCWWELPVNVLCVGLTRQTHIRASFDCHMTWLWRQIAEHCRQQLHWVNVIAHSRKTS